MIFSDRQIRHALLTGRIGIDPAPQDDQFAPSAVDLHVGEEFKTWRPPAPDPAPVRLTRVNLPDWSEMTEPLPPADDGSVVIPPGQFLLSRTRETLSLPLDSKLAARVEGRSTYARLGLVVHMTAPTIHAGFSGSIVLEIMNFGPYPLALDPGRTRICQVIFEELGSDPTCVLNTVYQGQQSVLGNQS